jgi:hypothetical protein
MVQGHAGTDLGARRHSATREVSSKDDQKRKDISKKSSKRDLEKSIKKRPLF